MSVATTPARLRWLLSASVVGCVILAVVSWSALGSRGTALREARTAAERLLAVQDIRVAVVRADSLASSSYLIGGGERNEDRLAYLDEIASATSGITRVAAGADDSQAADLAEAADLLGRYVGLVEQARANNRQGFPIGAAYQRQANTLVNNSVVERDNDGDGDPDVDVVGLLRNVEQAERVKVNEALAAAHGAGWWAQAVGWPLVGVLVFALVWMQRRFKRVVNVPLAAAAALIGVALVIAGTTSSRGLNKADEAVEGPLVAADRASQARAAGYDARSQEALRLISRGSGQAYEQAWNDAYATASALVERGAQFALGSYEFAHDALVDADNQGNWEAAVDSHLEIDASTLSSASTFAELDLLLSRQADSSAREAQTLFDESDDGQSGSRWALAVLALASAALAVVGFGRRLREYR